MSKLPLSELENARRNPSAYRQLLDRRSEGGKGVFSWGYYNALREAIRHFHKMNDSASAGHSHLVNGLERFTNRQRSQEIVNQFAWYIDDYNRRGWIRTQTYHTIVVPFEDTRIQLRCSGEISRLDIVPIGGYAAWIFRSQKPEGWKQELRMPIIQYIAAKMFGVPGSEIKVGVISFQERFADFHTFNDEQIATAYLELIDLITKLFQR